MSNFKFEILPKLSKCKTALKNESEEQSESEVEDLQEIANRLSQVDITTGVSKSRKRSAPQFPTSIEEQKSATNRLRLAPASEIPLKALVQKSDLEVVTFDDTTLNESSIQIDTAPKLSLGQQIVTKNGLFTSLLAYLPLAD
jgi:hypothetical protein